MTTVTERIKEIKQPRGGHLDEFGIVGARTVVSHTGYPLLNAGGGDVQRLVERAFEGRATGDVLRCGHGVPPGVVPTGQRLLEPDPDPGF